MTKGIYSGQDNIQLSEMVQDLYRSHEAAKGAPIEVVEIQEPPAAAQVVSQSATIQDLSKITHISQISGAVGQTPPQTTYFTTNKGKYKLDLDTSAFYPTPATMISAKKFKENYAKQLASLIYNDQDELNFEQLIKVVHLVNLTKSQPGLIKVTSAKFSRMLPTIVRCMNEFFSKNYQVLSGIEGMFNGASKVPE